MPTFTYVDESPRLYPYPPIGRVLEPGDQVDLDEAELPSDGRFRSAELCMEPELARLRALAASYREETAPREAPDDAQVSGVAPPAGEPAPVTPPASAAAKASKTPKE